MAYSAEEAMIVLANQQRDAMFYHPVFNIAKSMQNCNILYFLRDVDGNNCCKECITKSKPRQEINKIDIGTKTGISPILFLGIICARIRIHTQNTHRQ